MRAEACRAMAQLGLGEDRVLKSLNNVVIVDDDPTVVSEARRALLELGYSEDVRDEMLLNVCGQVKQLSTKETITNSVMAAETSRCIFPVCARDYLEHRSR